MLKADAAEWVLSLTTTPERATAASGDLIEEAEVRGTFWFWSNLIRLTTSFVWRIWSAEPLRMVWLAFGACILSAALTLILVLAVIGVSEVILRLTQAFGLNASVDRIASFAVSWTVLACQCLTGRWLARRAPGRELAACVAFLCADLALWTLVPIFLLSVDKPLIDVAEVVFGSLVDLASSAFLLVGVHQIRRQSTLA